MVGLAYWDNGFKQMSANKPLHMPEDYKGLKFRIQSSKVLEAQFRELGAIPQVMAFSEVYQALQTGVVDGQENTPSNMYTQKFHEVQKYTTLTNHGYIGYVVVVNKKFWDDLPADIRGQLDKAMKEATVYSNEISETGKCRSAGRDQEVRARPRSSLRRRRENAAMHKAMEPLYQDMASRVGKQLIDDVVKAHAASPTNNKQRSPGLFAGARVCFQGWGFQSVNRRRAGAADAASVGNSG